jgi:CBS domain-containing protein
MNDPILAADLMSRPVHRVTLDVTVAEAAEFLLRHGISGAPVVDAHGRPVGVFTMNDIARHVQGRMLNLPVIDPKRERALETREPIPEDMGFHFEALEGTKVADLMSFGLVTVFPQATLEEVIRSLVTQKIHRVFVISEAGELEGVITTMDVLKWMDRRFVERREASRERVA